MVTYTTLSSQKIHVYSISCSLNNDVRIADLSLSWSKILRTHVNSIYISMSLYSYWKGFRVDSGYCQREIKGQIHAMLLWRGVWGGSRLLSRGPVVDPVYIQGACGADSGYCPGKWRDISYMQKGWWGRSKLLLKGGSGLDPEYCQKGGRYSVFWDRSMILWWWGVGGDHPKCISRMVRGMSL